MDYTNPDFWISIGVGGGIIGFLSLIQQFLTKNQEEPYSGIRYRAVFRDFFFGAFLTALLYMFLPDSIINLISAGKSGLQKLTGGSLEAVPSEFEIQTGPARF